MQHTSAPHDVTTQITPASVMQQQHIQHALLLALILFISAFQLYG
jgi:hypothetical protein